MGSVEVEVALRQKNQLTLPDAVVKRLGLHPGDRLVVELDESSPDTTRLRPIRRSYAGILSGVYGTPDEARTYIADERTSWGE